jgi:hypothetical protein
MFLVLALLLSSCSTRELTSESYKFGKETGANWRELTSEIDVVSAWVGVESGETIEIPEVEKETACKAMWLIIGWPKFGLKDMAENRENFVDGCITTIGS